MLEELLYEERSLVDGWDKNKSIYCREDWPYFTRRRDRIRQKNAEQVRQAIPGVRKALEKKGPLSSIDLDLDSKVNWSWAPTRLARAALDTMFSTGELVIHHRVGTRKVYDLACRHLPNSLLSEKEPNPTDDEYYEWRLRRRVGGVGMLWARSGSGWLGIPEFTAKKRRKTIDRLLQRNLLVEIEVEEISPSFYIRAKDAPLMQEVKCQGKEDSEPHAAILAPLDNLLWDRKMIARLFDFEYVWEVYKPASERKYGYYVLPVLCGDEFVARFEPKISEDANRMTVNWWWEDCQKPSPMMIAALKSCLGDFLRYLGLQGVTLSCEADSCGDLQWLTNIDVS